METIRKLQTYMLKFGVFVIGALALTAGNAQAGDGWGDNTDAAGVNIRQQTFYANSPSGIHTRSVCPGGAVQCNDADKITSQVDSGAMLRKFVDPLPRLTGPGGPAGNSSGKYIPLAVATPWKNSQGVTTGDDYYEIAAVEWKEKFHSDLANDSTVRGYVQIDPAATDAAAGIQNGATAVPGSKAVQLFEIDGVTPVKIARPNGAGGFVMVDAYAVDKPHYLGPVIVANRGTPTRIKFINALPVGRAAGGKRNGDLFLPVDESLPGAGFGPDGQVKFTQNRVEIHLHGGDNPWISDGTPHQWITPAGEADLANPNSVASEAAAKNVDASKYLRGVSAVNVPDMPNPGPGAMTYYFPNGESARLMFYHDHAFGLTRLNVYAGVAAGYLLNDGVEQQAILDGKLPAEQIPLVFQDKTFVPKDIAIQDARWDTTYWGQESDFWFPHVYETNQDPSSFDGTKPVGRWDWGPYFWPVFPSYYDRLPNGKHEPALMSVGGGLEALTGLTEVTTTPEAFVDTPIVNGQAYPKMEVEPRAYRFRMLNAMNDRFINLGLYIAADKMTTDANDPFNPAQQPTLCDGSSARPDTTIPALSDCTEMKMVNFDTSYPGIYYNSITGRTQTLTPNGSPTFPDGTDPRTAGLNGTGWGATSGHLAVNGGVPDPATAGPDILQIGNEGGMLAKVAVIPSTPMNYEANKRSTTMLNILERGLWLPPAGRADAIIDFSAYAGKTLILYNDAPAPLPAGDPRIDYYTGMGDYSAVGGHSNVLPGYGPNDRTVMQIYVKPLPPAPALVVADLEATVAALHGQTQPKPVVPQTRYAAAFAADPVISTAPDTNARIYTGAIYLGKYNGLTFTTPEDMKYTDVPRLPDVIGQPNNRVCTTPANCRANLQRGTAFAQAGQPVTAYVENKAIQELFEPTYGRMNATLGVELPFTSSLTQTTIPLGYVDPTTETVADGETQFWKITHNGVDSHPVHFHLVNLQVINRMGWDGTIKQPTDEEIGWKETVIMNPLEDIVVAVRAKAPKLPFGLPNSVRPRDPSQAVSTPGNLVTAGFTQIDPVTGNPASVYNKEDDFGWEYVWHCHILGHEENDFMRAFVFNYWDDKNYQKNGDGSFVKDLLAPKNANGNRVAILDTATIKPDAVNDLTIVGNTLSWTDPTQAYIVAGNVVVQNPATLANPKNEIGFNLTRTGTPKVDVVGGVASVKTVKLIANVESYTDTDPLADIGLVDYTYTIAAYNQMGSAPASNVAQAAPTMPIASNDLTVPTVTSTSATLTWTDNATNETTYKVEYSANGGVPTTIVIPQHAGTGAMSYVVTGLLSNTLYDFRVAASNGAGDAWSNVASNTTNAASATAVAVSNVTTNSATVAWTNTNPGVLNAEVLTVSPLDAGIVVNGHDVTGLKSNTAYTFSVVLTGSNGTAAPAVSVPATTNADSATAVAVNALTATTATINWTDPATGGNAVLTVSPNAGVTVAGNLVSGLTPSTDYTFSVVVTGTNGVAAPAATATATTNADVTGMQVTAVTADSATVTWATQAGSTAVLSVSPAATVVINGNTATVTGMAPNTLHNFSLVVTGGNGNALPTVTASTTTNAISAGAVTVANITDTTAALTWTNLNPGTTTAVLTVSPAGATVSQVGNTATVSGLTPYTQYTFSVVVTGTNTVPAAATTTTARTHATLVAATNVAGKMISATQVALQWTDMSVGETGYQVLQNGAVITTIAGAANTGNTIAATVTATMTAGTLYQFTVAPLEDAIAGPVSVAVSIDLRVRPSSLVVTSATTVPGSGSVVLTWAQPANNAASIILQRRVAPFGAWVTVTTLASNVLGYTDSGLIDGTYQYQVRNTNAAGNSNWSVSYPAGGLPVTNSSIVLTPATNVSAYMIANNRVTLGWTDNALGETTYQVQMQRNAGNWNTIGTAPGVATSGNVLTATVTANMNGGSTYNFRVLPVVSTQVGLATTTATISLIGLPGAVSGLTATPAFGSVTLAWAQPANNVGRIRVQRATVVNNVVGGFTTIASTLAGNSTGYVDTTVVAGTSYQYRVRTDNPNGSSAYVNTATVLAPLAPPPAAPADVTGVSASSAVAGEIVVGFTNPNGGASSVTVLVKDSLLATVASNTAATTSPLTFTGIPAGNYTVEVSVNGQLGAPTSAPVTVQ